MKKSNISLIQACFQGKYDKVEKMLKGSFLFSPAEVNVKDDFGTTPLIAASGQNQFEIVKLLIEKDADINMKDLNGWSPLMAACDHNNYKIVEVLIDNGADINTKSGIGETAIGLAIEHGHAYITDLLLKNGAKYEYKETTSEILIKDDVGIMNICRELLTDKSIEELVSIAKKGKDELLVGARWQTVYVSNHEIINRRFLLCMAAIHELTLSENFKDEDILDIASNALYSTVRHYALNQLFLYCKNKDLIFKNIAQIALGDKCSKVRLEALIFLSNDVLFLKDFIEREKYAFVKKRAFELLEEMVGNNDSSEKRISVNEIKIISGSLSVQNTEEMSNGIQQRLEDAQGAVIDEFVTCPFCTNNLGQTLFFEHTSAKTITIECQYCGEIFEQRVNFSELIY